MKRGINKSAFTLIELIVASLLVSIVIYGVISLHTVLSGNNQDYAQHYTVKSQTQVTLNHILNNLALAYGSANTNDEAILYAGNAPVWAVTNTNTFCIHQPPYDANLGGGNLIKHVTVGAILGDIWLCYQWLPATYQIQWCAEQYTADGSLTRGATSCSNATAATNLLAGPTYLGTANSDPTSSAGPANLIFTNSAAQLQVSETISNCMNNALAENGSTNPCSSLTGSVIPLQVTT